MILPSSNQMSICGRQNNIREKKQRHLFFFYFHETSFSWHCIAWKRSLFLNVLKAFAIGNEFCDWFHVLLRCQDQSFQVQMLIYIFNYSLSSLCDCKLQFYMVVKRAQKKTKILIKWCYVNNGYSFSTFLLFNQTLWN